MMIDVFLGIGFFFFIFSIFRFLVYLFTAFLHCKVSVRNYAFESSAISAYMDFKTRVRDGELK